MTSSVPEFINHVVTGSAVHDLVLDGSKIGWWRDRVEAWARGERIAPVTMDVAWTRKCNAACVFCVFPDSQVLMADGSTKPMVDVKPGDIVVSLDDDGRPAKSTVAAQWQTSAWARGLEIVTPCGSLKCTADHLVLTAQGWSPAGDLRAGDLVNVAESIAADTREALPVKIVVTGLATISAIYDAGYSPVYDLECRPHHNFVADGVVVHNCYATMQANEGGEITKKHAFEFLEDAAEIGVKGISLISDGESTVVPWYAESIEYAARLGIKIGIGTNGVRLKRPLLERILPHLSYLRFNFSAGDQKRYSEIMGLQARDYHQVVQNVRDAMDIVNRDGLQCSVNMQMVTMPEFHDQIMPLARLAKELRPNYLIYKHCADDIKGQLGVDYKKYDALYDTFREAEAMSDETFRVVVKWARLADEGKRDYKKCFGPPFQLQMSGSGLIAPCGFLFNERYAAFHCGNITTTRFKEIWQSDRYWDVIRYLGSDEFNPQQRCGPNCLQTLTNSWLYKFDKGEVSFPQATAPAHLEFL